MRRFQLVRHRDISGISGTGLVADGVRFADGQVVIRWRGLRKSTVIWDSLDDAMVIHGHNGSTYVKWLD